ncbi:MAG: cobalamin biosynthesis central domain-containing protein [Mariprofundales bacterium]|nr:cobalamin biosynthesis central domain-containing protein [Mariprofundales bacterium]
MSTSSIKSITAPLDGRVALVAITKHGAHQAVALAHQLPAAEIVTSQKFAHALSGVTNRVHSYDGALRAQIAWLFANYDQIICFISLGAVVRLIAPHLQSKDRDPGILVVDDAGQYVIPVLSGHVGGANSWAEYVAELMRATAVVTTASDVGKTIAVDILGRELGWQIEAPKLNITRVSAAVVNEERVAFIDERDRPTRDWWQRPTELPATIHLFTRFEEVDLAQYAALLWVTDRKIADNLWQQLQERVVVYRPPRQR